MNRAKLIVEFAKCIGAMSGAGNAYHVIAGHQMSEEVCGWPVCKGIRETRKDVEKVVEELRADELAT